MIYLTLWSKAKAMADQEHLHVFKLLPLIWVFRKAAILAVTLSSAYVQCGVMAGMSYYERTQYDFTTTIINQRSLLAPTLNRRNQTLIRSVLVRGGSNNPCDRTPSLSSLQGGATKINKTDEVSNIKVRKRKIRKIAHKNEIYESSTSSNIEKERILDDNKNSRKGDIDSDPYTLTVSCVTWNLAEKSPSEEQSSFLKDIGKKSDVIFLSAQECENIQPRRAEGHRSREWRRLCMYHIGRDFVPVAMYSLGGIQASVFVRKQYTQGSRQRQQRSDSKDNNSKNKIYLDEVKLASVACGIGNAFHNKGAIGVFVSFKDGTSSTSRTLRRRKGGHSSPSMHGRGFLFVAAHMAAHVKNVDGRNDDFWRITKELQEQAPKSFMSTNSQLREQHRRRRSQSLSSTDTKEVEVHSGDVTDFYDCMDYVFFCGDLNYRIELPREVTEHAIYSKKEMSDSEEDINSNDDDDTYEENKQCKKMLLLLRHDQLLQQISKHRAFPNFREARINFNPTFKLDGGGGATTDEQVVSRYDSSPKQRVPAWTDRILFHTSRSRFKQNKRKLNAALSEKAGAKTTNDFLDVQESSPLKVLQYTSIPSACHSDHRPVVGTFQCHI